MQIWDHPGASREALGDIRGARSLIDLNVDKEMGLQVHYAQGCKYGTFYGPWGKDQAYLGVVKGPIPLWFSSEVVVNLRELKVIQYTEPSVLIGADVLCGGHQGWNF